jgi:hypothetical protein
MDHTNGKLQLMETLAHDNVYSFTADSAIRDGVHNIDGKIEFYQDSHPAIFIESGGHGIYGTRGSASKFTLERGEFQTSTGITLIYKGTAERPRHANDRLVGYDLLPIYDEWWLKAEEGKWNKRTFDDYFRYEPYGDRPGLSFKIGGAFLGRKEAGEQGQAVLGLARHADAQEESSGQRPVGTGSGLLGVPRHEFSEREALFHRLRVQPVSRHRQEAGK